MPTLTLTRVPLVTLSTTRQDHTWGQYQHAFSLPHLEDAGATTYASHHLPVIAHEEGKDRAESSLGLPSAGVRQTPQQLPRSISTWICCLRPHVDATFGPETESQPPPSTGFSPLPAPSSSPALPSSFVWAVAVPSLLPGRLRSSLEVAPAPERGCTRNNTGSRGPSDCSQNFTFTIRLVWSTPRVSHRCPPCRNLKQRLQANKLSEL